MPTPNAARRQGLTQNDFIPDLAYHRSGPACPGDASLTLTIAGAAVRLEGLATSQADVLARRYGIFCREAAGDPVARLRVTRAGRPDFLRVAAPGEYYRIDTRWEEGALLAASYEWAGWIDFARGEGGIALTPLTETDAAAFDRSIENFLRVVYAHLMVKRGGFVLHAAGLVRQGRAYLFFGPSGAGKTTVTAMSPDALVLSDDLTLVVRIPGAGYGASSVPFRGVFAPQPESDQSYPIAGFFRLVQDETDALERVRGARAVGELLASLPFVTDRPEAAREVMDAVSGAAGRVPVYRLRFRKDRTFWQVIEAETLIFDDFSADRGINT